MSLIATGLLACSGDATGPTPLAPSQAYWGLQLNYHAVNLALTPPYNKIQLLATALNAEGDSLAGVGPITYTAADSTVSVDSTGLVTANFTTKSVSAPTFVIATLQYQNVTLVDTALIQVTAVPSAAPLQTFTVQLAANASSPCNLNLSGISLVENCGPLVVNATDVESNVLSSASTHLILINYTSSNPLLARVNQSGKITELDTGQVTLTASTWVYGVAKRDSLRYVISWARYQPLSISSVTPANSLTPVLVFTPAAVIVSVGGTVSWRNPFVQPIDIVFDDSTAVEAGCILSLCNFYHPTTGSGNVPPFYTDPTKTDTSVFAKGSVIRSFPVAGTYHYHSTLYPSSTGVIYVREALSQ